MNKLSADVGGVMLLLSLSITMAAQASQRDPNEDAAPRTLIEPQSVSAVPERKEETEFSGRSGTRSYNWDVSSRQAWVRTDIEVLAGQAFSVKATGRVFTLPQPEGSSSGPDGQSYDCTSQCTYPEGRFGQLIGKVGESGSIFPIGSDYKRNASEEGILFLGVNDCCDWSDNSGVFRTTILVEAEGQRDKARRIACSSGSGSLGRAAICPNFDYWYVNIIGNWCAGQVGDLYENNKERLAQPATDANIESWADMETKFFQSQDRCTAALGRRLSASDRARRMEEARDEGNDGS
jgi:hypothetical protein